MELNVKEPGYGHLTDEEITYLAEEMNIDTAAVRSMLDSAGITVASCSHICNR